MLYTFLIALMVVYVYDLTDFSHSMLEVLWRYAYKSRPFPDELRWVDIHPLLKPLECSRCACWWLTLISLPIMGEFTLPMVGWCMFLSYLTPIIKDVMILLQDIVTRMIESIAYYFGL